MEVTKVVFTRVNTEVDLNKKHGYVASCDVVLDDCLALRDISLCIRKNNLDFNLIFPSKQDVYKTVKTYNEGVFLKYPPNPKKRLFVSGSRSYEEFYHPLSKDFYVKLLNAISDAFEVCISDDGKILKPFYTPDVSKGIIQSK